MTLEEQLRAQAEADGFANGITIQVNPHNITVFGHLHIGTDGCVMGSGKTIAEAYRKACAEKASKTVLAWERLDVAA